MLQRTETSCTIVCLPTVWGRTHGSGCDCQVSTNCCKAILAQEKHHQKWWNINWHAFSTHKTNTWIHNVMWYSCWNILLAVQLTKLKRSAWSGCLIHCWENRLRAKKLMDWTGDTIATSYTIHSGWPMICFWTEVSLCIDDSLCSACNLSL